MQKISSFTQLIAWQKAHKLVLTTYKLIAKFPKTEKFALSDQEGFSRQTDKEKIQFYFTAKGSLTELQNQLLIARDVNYLARPDFDQIAQDTVEVHKLINGLIKSKKLYTKY